MSSGPFEARWVSRCAECGDTIEIGEQARYNDEDEVVREDCCGSAYAWEPEYSQRGYR